MSQQSPYESAPQAPPGPPRAARPARARDSGSASAPAIVDILILADPAHRSVPHRSEPSKRSAGSLITIAYWTIMDGGPKGQTVGKMALGIRVYDLRQGGPIGYGRGFLRALMKYFLSWILLLGYLWMLWDREKQTWHDKVAGSVVVPADAYK